MYRGRCTAVLMVLMFAILTLMNNRAASGVPAAEYVWPISGSSTPARLSSTYGPRLKASSNFRYDYHQGIDIPTPLNTPILAVAGGTVRIAGAHPEYSDLVVQIDHGDTTYSTYLHLNSVSVVAGQTVIAGQVIALSGHESDFPHLHFEIRQGGYTRAYAIHPLRLLPYSNTLSPTVQISSTLPASLAGYVTTPAEELDVTRITISVRNPLTNELIDFRELDYEARNLMYNGQPTILDQADLEDVLIAPAAFTSASEQYVVGFTFTRLQGHGPVKLTMCAYDLRGHRACAVRRVVWSTSYLPMVRR